MANDNTQNNDQNTEQNLPYAGINPVDPSPIPDTHEHYSYLGPHGEYEEDGDPDGYGPQDQFGDVDGQDPYENLDEEVDEETPGGEGIDDPEATLYGLAEPLAQEGDISRQGSEHDSYGTRISQDQRGYQQ